MKISDETVDLMAHLARLEFEGSKKLEIKNDLEKIISFIDKLQEVPTDDVEPLVFMSNEINVLREDISEVTITQQQALQNAPKKDSDYFRIPKVLNN